MSELLPPNATPLERALADVGAELAAVPVPVGDLWNPEACPAPLLPWLAWALSVDRWNPAWPEAVQRRVIADAIPVHRIKGTPASVEDALASLGLPAEILEWFDDTEALMAPGTFRVAALANGATAPLVDATFVDAIETVRTTKRASQHFDFSAMALAGSGLGFAGDAGPWIDLSADLAGGGRDAGVGDFGLAAANGVHLLAGADAVGDGRGAAAGDMGIAGTAGAVNLLEMWETL